MTKVDEDSGKKHPTTWADVGFTAVWFAGLAAVILAFGYVFGG